MGRLKVVLVVLDTLEEDEVFELDEVVAFRAYLRYTPAVGKQMLSV